jgi:membrane protein DedA with SNARE-associated domain
MPMNWLIAFSSAYPILFYFIVFAGMFIEGDFMLLLLGALSRGGYVHFMEVLPVAIAAALVHDMLFWWIGSRLARLQKKKYLFFDLESMTRFMERIKPAAGLFIVLSKFAWNFNRIILVSMGYVKVPFKKLIKYSSFTAVIWPVLYMSVGYVFADQTDIFKQRIEVVGALMVGILALVALFENSIRKGFTRIMKNGSDHAEGGK